MWNFLEPFSLLLTGFSIRSFLEHLVKEHQQSGHEIRSSAVIAVTNFLPNSCSLVQLSEGRLKFFHASNAMKVSLRSLVLADHLLLPWLLHVDRKSHDWDTHVARQFHDRCVSSPFIYALVFMLWATATQQPSDRPASFHVCDLWTLQLYLEPVMWWPLDQCIKEHSNYFCDDYSMIIAMYDMGYKTIPWTWDFFKRLTI